MRICSVNVSLVMTGRREVNEVGVVVCTVAVDDVLGILESGDGLYRKQSSMDTTS